jgi:hypothetical protein
MNKNHTCKLGGDCLIDDWIRELQMQTTYLSTWAGEIHGDPRRLAEVRRNINRLSKSISAAIAASEDLAAILDARDAAQIPTATD